MQLRSIVLAAVGTLALSASAVQARVIFTLAIDNDGSGTLAPGKFAVFADDLTTGDTTVTPNIAPDPNSGIASFGVALAGTTSITNVSPMSNYFKSGSPPSFRSAGFTLLRSADDVIPLSGSQDTTGTTAVIIYGFGQTSGNLATATPSGFADLGGTQEAYNATLLLATGTYTVGAPPSFIMGSTATLSNVFDNNTSTNTHAATVQTRVTPEPGSCALFGVAGLLALRRRRGVLATPAGC